MAVGQRRDMRMTDPQYVRELEELAQDGRDMRAAIDSLGSKRLQAMEVLREADRSVKGVPELVAFSSGWLAFESDLGDALLKIQRKREGTEPVDADDPDGMPF